MIGNLESGCINDPRPDQCLVKSQILPKGGSDLVRVLPSSTKRGHCLLVAASWPLKAAQPGHSMIEIFATGRLDTHIIFKRSDQRVWPARPVSCCVRWDLCLLRCRHAAENKRLDSPVRLTNKQRQQQKSCSPAFRRWDKLSENFDSRAKVWGSGLQGQSWGRVCRRGGTEPTIGQSERGRCSHIAPFKNLKWFLFI